MVACRRAAPRRGAVSAAGLILLAAQVAFPFGWPQAALHAPLPAAVMQQRQEQAREGDAGRGGLIAGVTVGAGAAVATAPWLPAPGGVGPLRPPTRVGPGAVAGLAPRAEAAGAGPLQGQVAPGPPDTAAEAERLGLPPAVGPLLVREARRQGVDPGLVAAVVDLESGFRADLTHSDADGTLDRGLMQLNDSTSPWLAEQVGIQPFDVERDPYDPEANLRMGVWYLAFLLRRYDGDLGLTLLAYNAGMGTADRRRHERQDPDSDYRRAVERIAVSRGWWGGRERAAPPPEVAGR